VTRIWVIQQCLVQVNIVFRNSGTTEAICNGFLRRWGGRAISCLRLKRHKEKLDQHDMHSDPIIRLQYLARLGWQYDIADIAALVATPTIVSFFVWRDGFYRMTSTPIIVLPCQLGNCGSVS